MKKFMMLLMVFALGTTMSFAQKVIKSQQDNSNKTMQTGVDSKTASELNKGNAKPTLIILKPGNATDKIGKKSDELKKEGGDPTWQWMHQGNDDRIQRTTDQLKKGNAKPTLIILKPGNATDKVGKKSEELKKNGAGKATWRWMRQGNDDRIQRTTDQLKKGNAKPTLIILKPGNADKGVQNIKNVKNLQQNKKR